MRKKVAVMAVAALLALVLTAGTSMATSYASGSGPVTINGHEYAETIYGSDGPEAIRGLGGGDYLAGLGGSDSVSGNRGDDLVRGDAGNDTLRGGLGSDRIEGGTGDDRIYSYGDYEADVVDCGTGRDSVRADAYDLLIGCESVERL